MSEKKNDKNVAIEDIEAQSRRLVRRIRLGVLYEFERCLFCGLGYIGMTGKYLARRLADRCGRLIRAGYGASFQLYRVEILSFPPDSSLKTCAVIFKSYNIGSYSISGFLVTGHHCVPL